MEQVTTNLKSIALEVVEIARKAGTVIMDVYDNYDDIGIEHKSDDSPLTMADKKANDVIVEGLLRLNVQYPIISEENKAIPYDERKTFEKVWVVDPLDGTKEFIKRNGEFTVNIALVENGRSILGVIYAPAMDQMYWAAEGCGSWCTRASQHFEQMKSNPINVDQKGIRIVCSRSHMNDTTKAMVDRFEDPELVPTGSSLKICLIAEGKAEFYPRLGPTMEWDICAAQVILEESGGTLIRMDDHQPLRYNREDMLNPHFLAFGGTDTAVMIQKIS